MAVMALALGIGANANVFSFVNAYLLHPLPLVKDLDRIALIEGRIRSNTTGNSYLDFVDLSHENRAFEALAATTTTIPILTGRGEAERVVGVQASASYFDVFGAQPVIGRAFLASEAGEPVVIISDRFWQRRFGSSRDAVGQSLVFDNVPHRIIGVMPPRFRTEWNDFDFWQPFSTDTLKTPRGRRIVNIFGKLKPGVSLAAAQQDINTIASRLEAQYPDTNATFKMQVHDLVDRLGAGPRESINIMVYVVGFVLLIACSNVANLQLARATGRASEIAIRISMGASRWQIMRQVVMESTIVAMLGGAVGLALAMAGAKVLLASLPPMFQPINQTLLDGYVVLFTVGIAMLTGVVSGIAPAFQVSRVSVNDVLKEAGRGNTGGRGGKLRNSLVVVELSLALVLLLAAGLLIQSFIRMQDVNPGFRADRLLTASVFVPDTKYPTPAHRAEFFRRLVERASAIPGVQAATAASGLPAMPGGSGGFFVVEGQTVPSAGSEYFARSKSVTPNYFQTMGIALRNGRYFGEQDVENGQRVAIVSERLAQQYFPKTDPLGKRVKFGRNLQSSSPWLTIVGVAADVRPWNVAQLPNPEIYMPMRQDPRAFTWIVMRTASPDPASVAPAFRSEVRTLDRDQPITDLQTMDRAIQDSMTIPRLMTALMTIFAAIAMGMAAMGIYGVISYSVAQRTHELGIRMALGAGSGSVVKLVLRQALWMVAIGVGVGTPVAAVTTQVLQSYLYGVGARDPLTFVAIPLTLGAVGVLASYIPARRATKVDPVVALRCE